MTVSESTRRFLVTCGVCLSLATGFARPVHADSAQYFYDAAGQLSAVVDPVNGSAVYSYDPAGNLTQVSRYAAGAAVIATANPSSAAPGSTITISGVGFGTTANTSVSFNGTSATPSAVTPTQITVVVPGAATTGPLVVTSPTGSSVNSFVFSVTQGAPTITSLSSSTVSIGDSLTINGTNFSTTASNNHVTINGQYALITSATATALTVTVPTASSGPLQVSTPAGAATPVNLIVNPNISGIVFGSTTNSSMGQSPTLSFGVTNQVDLVFFNATAGQNFNLQMASGTVDGIRAAVITPDGQWLPLTFDLLALQQYFYSGPKTLNLTGTYTAIIALAPGYSSGQATVNLIAVPPDAIGTTTIDGPAVPLSNTTIGQNMVVNFSGLANQQVELTVTTSGNSGCGNVSLQYPNNGAAIGYYVGTQWNTYLQMCGSQTQSLGPFTLPVSGPYSVRLAGGDAHGINDFIGSASFQISSVTHSPASQARLKALTNKTMMADTILTSSAKNSIVTTSFNGASGHSAWITIDADAMQPQGGNFYVALIAPDGHSLLRGDQSTGAHYASGAVHLPKSGDYQIKIAAADAATGSYHVKVNVP